MFAANAQTQPQIITAPAAAAVRDIVYASKPACSSAATCAPAAGGVQLWVADASNFQWLSARIHVLSEAERTQFAAINQPAARWIAMSARIVLRIALSDISNNAIAPCEWTFTTAANGKKRIKDGQPQIHFSVSHNDQMAVVAVSAQTNLGVDVEAFDLPCNEDVVAEFFSPAERANLDTQNQTQRNQQFARLWTLKEAYSKLTGEGFAANFASLEFDALADIMTSSDRAQFATRKTANCQIAIATEAGFNGDITQRDLI